MTGRTIQAREIDGLNNIFLSIFDWLGWVTILIKGKILLSISDKFLRNVSHFQFVLFRKSSAQ
jgi:hypothetical protein